MMRAVVQNGFGPPEQVLSIKEVPKPTLVNPSHILVRVHATSVNTPDWSSTIGKPYFLRLFLGGLWGGPKDRIMGSDVAGVVEEVGNDVTHVQVGDEVFGSTGDSLLGAFAEYALVPKDRLIRKPASLSFEEAAGAVMSGMTARAAIRDTAKVQPGTHLLINGASGSVGTLALQIAKADGAIVTGVCSGKNRDLLTKLGADHVIDYTTHDFTDPNTVPKRPNRKTKEDAASTSNSSYYYDVVLDNVMNRPYSETSRIVNPNGGFVIPNSVGVGRSNWFGAIPYFFWKPSNYPLVDCTTNQTTLQEMADLLTSCSTNTNDMKASSRTKVKVLIDKTYSMEDAPNAVAHMASMRARGQVIIKFK